MLELLQKLFYGHVHKYEIIDRHGVRTYRNEDDKYPIRFTETITSRCSVCGKIKSVKVEK